jgi:hypothetical protein
MNRKRITLFALLFLMVFNLTIPAVYAQQPLSEMGETERNQKIKQEIERFKKEREKYKHPKVDDVLVEIEEEYKKGGEDAAKRFAAGEVLKDEDGNVITKSEDAYKKGGVGAVKSKFGHDKRVRIKEGNKIRVVVYLVPESTLDRAKFESFGGTFGHFFEYVFEADIPFDKIKTIADEVEGIQRIELPDVPVPLSYQSEGLGKIRFSNYSAAGIRGSGVKIAVIDLGFAGISSTVSNGDLPSNVIKVDCTGTSCVSTAFSSETEKHGTAVAEIVYDMAKEAQLYLIKVDSQVNLIAAKDYCVANGIKIINHSVGWYNKNFYDGICYNPPNDSPVCTAKDAYNNRNILWINSAGNEAQRHYEATYNPSGGECHTMPNGKMPEFDLTWDDMNSGKTLNAYLTWNAWPTTNQNYDLYIFKDGGIFGGSTIVQNGTKPTEGISWAMNPFTAEIGTYQVCVNKVSATSNHAFELFIGSSPGPSKTFNSGSYISSGSLLGPADAADVLTVGAIDYTIWTSGPPESFSSMGPNNSGLVKPDIMGPDYVTTYSYGIEGFPGTSAASPHVAGAAALLLSKNSSQSASQLRSALINSAIPMGSGYPNNTYGYGRLELPMIYRLDISKSGTGFGTVSSSPAGINCDTSCTDEVGGFDANSSVTLTATPNDRSKFSLWSGACTGTDDTCTLTMNTDKNVIAYFDGKPVITITPTSYDFGSIYGSANAFTITNVGLADLTMGSISLSGTNSSDFNIPFTLDNCTGQTLVPYTSCSFTVELLPASAGPKSAAINIPSNDPDNGTLSVPVSANIPYTYIISTTAGSGGTISPSFATVNFGGSQTFTITPNSGYHIADVKVDGISVTDYPTSTNTSYSLTLSNTKAAHTISATFSNTYKLTISKSGTGSGTVTSSPFGISCGTGCSKSFTNATAVILTASPDTDSTFTGWSGGGCSGTEDCTVTLNEDTTVTATFTAPYIVISDIAAGGDHSVVLRNSGMLWVWGDNTYGQVGDGTTTTKLLPAQTAIGEWVAVSAGYSHTAAIGNDGTLWAWGFNGDGELGDSTTIDRRTPVQIGTNSDWVAISAGAYHTVALKNDGSLWAWGANWYGQLGDGTTTARYAPVKITTDTNWAAIAAGNWHTVAIKTDGSLWAWGANWYGQLGDGSSTDKAIPTRIGVDYDWTAITAWRQSYFSS